jgi:hypothetical protein
MNTSVYIGQVVMKPINITRVKSKIAEFTNKHRRRNYVESIT